MTRNVTVRAVRYHQFGDPRKVLQLDHIEVRTDLEPDEVLVRWLASPVNPLDINLVEGVYATRNQLPAIAGAEGVGRVEKIGVNVQNLIQGDHVLSLESSTWVELAVVRVKALLRIRKEINLILAAQLLINPPTAYGMLNFFESLQPGDYIIQNAAGSGVGQAVIQLAKAYGFKSINLVRDRPNIESLKQELRQLGADHVFTEGEFKQNGAKLIAAVGKRIKLACNGVGGRSALIISSVVADSGMCITYGGMSRQPHEFSTSALVFKNLKSVGYSNGRWMRDPKNREKRAQMFEELQDLILAGKFKPKAVQTHNLDGFRTAIERQIDGRHGKQLLFVSKQVDTAKI